MSQNPLKVAHKEGRKNDKFLKDSFAKYLGNSEHPRGRVLSVYRQGRLAMRSALNVNARQVPLSVADVLANMRREILEVGKVAISEMSVRGVDSATVQAKAYQDAGIDFKPVQQAVNSRPLEDGFIATFDDQSKSIQSLVNGGLYDKNRIIGDAGRLGILQPAPVITSGTEWLATALISAMVVWWFGGDDTQTARDTKFKKQVFAVVDNFTTDCCLRANGQIQPFRGKFRLRGTPRFANRMKWTPFHWNCRSTVV